MKSKGVRCTRCHGIIPILVEVAATVFESMTVEEWEVYLSFVSQSPFINRRIR